MIEFKYRSPEWVADVMPNWQDQMTQTTTTVHITTEEGALERILEVFRDFLRGAGYQIDGTLEVVGENEWIESSQSDVSVADSIADAAAKEDV
jgi:hypothetical protein